MRITNLILSGDFRAVNAILPFAPGIVLFGPNDAGKSNLIEAIEGGLGGLEPSRVDPLAPDNTPAVGVVFELDGLRAPSHPDRDLLARMIQFDDPPARFLADPNLRETAKSFVLDGDDEIELPNGTLDLDDLLEMLRDATLALAQERCSNWIEAADDFEIVLDAAMQSDLFLCGMGVPVLWLVFWGSLPAAALNALERIDAARETLWEDGHVPVLGSILDARAQPDITFGVLFTVGSEDLEFRPFEVVRVTSSEIARNELLDAVEGYVEDRVSRERSPADFKVAGIYESVYRRDPWLEEQDPGVVKLHDEVVRACVEISQLATEIAPPFVVREYDIALFPLAPDQWKVNRDRRIYPMVVVKRDVDKRGEERENFSLDVVGSGLAVWAGYAIREAVRLLREREQTKDLDDPRLPLPTLFVFDEPERHLHPAAQDEVREWIATRLDDGAYAMVATHAVPFLDLRREEVEYFRVYRDNAGETKVARITSDVIGGLSAHAEAGISNPAQIIQLTRAALVVEGAHDELVIDHFYGEELREQRVRVLPLFGARNAPALAETRFLRDAAIPMIILFDRTRAKAIRARHLPADASEEVRILWDLLRHWPEDRTPPRLVPFAMPDVICGIPEDVVRRVTRIRYGDRFRGWRPLILEHEKLRSSQGRAAPNFKKFALKEMGVTASPREFIRQCLNEAPLEARESSSLSRAMKRVLALASEI
jgi:hypothetical protein